jgi:predicted DNA-binding transcriptional regulator AlpA
VEKEFLTEKEVAAKLKLSTRVLQFWRQVGDGPNWYKIGRFVRYDSADINRFIESGLRVSSARATAEERNVAL